ncbi:hypothetical protein KC734_12990 [candidate division KSB1 bacterium]|nr:hypothetical protein [candidate division KSB1 bacterium]
MSYPSLFSVINEKEINIEAASPVILKNALWRTFNRDMSLGIAYLTDMAKAVKTSGRRLLRVEQPDSQLGQQLAWLLGTDISREICEQRLDIAFGFYNDCAPVAALKREDLNMNPLEQIQIQSERLQPESIPANM